MYKSNKETLGKYFFSWEICEYFIWLKTVKYEQNQIHKIPVFTWNL
jgi:hypothetical protein